MRDTEANRKMLHDRLKEQNRQDIRRELAAMAMQGILSNTTRMITGHESISVFAVEYADALLKELEK